MAFCPNILEGGGGLRIIILLKYESIFSGGDMSGEGTLQDGKKN